MGKRKALEDRSYIKHHISTGSCIHK